MIYTKQSEEYCRSIARLAEIGMEAAKVEVYPFEPQQIDYSKQTKAQKSEQTFNSIMYSYFESERLDNLEDTVKKDSDLLPISY